VVEPQPKSILVTLALKSDIWWQQFYDFLENQLPKCHHIGMAPPYQISGWYGARHTTSGTTELAWEDAEAAAFDRQQVASKCGPM